MRFSQILRLASVRFGGPAASARHVGVPISTFNAWLAGVSEPRFSEAIRVSMELGVPPRELIASCGRELATIAIRQNGKRTLVPRPRSLPPLISLDRSAA